jgi:glutamate synthase domain-containing protein 1
MLDVLGSRGVDGTGVALYGVPSGQNLVLRVKLHGRGTEEEQAARVQDRLASIAAIGTAEVRGDYLRLVLSAPVRGADDDDTGFAAIADAAESGDPGVEVFSIGHALEVVKQVGPASVLRDRYCLSTFRGTHGIGHTRLATESRVDISHCHPFWARPYGDIAVVHNGQITNYHKMRRQMEMRGVRFFTENDSEIIGLYIAGQLERGDPLQSALERSVDELDGTFTYLIATPQGIGMAKDFFATKPLIVAETDDFVAIASEEVALWESFGSALHSYQPAAREVHVWLR